MTSPRRAKRLQKLLQKQMRETTKGRLQEILKPKPRFWPKWFYKLIVNILLDIPETK